GDRVGDRGAPHHAEAVDRPPARGLDPFDVLAERERAGRARIEEMLAGILAEADQQLAFFGRVPEALALDVDCGRGILALLRLRAHASSVPRMTVALPWRVPSEPPVPCASASRMFFTWTAGCASPRICRTASRTLVRPPRLPGWLLQRPPPSVLKGSLPWPEIRLPSETNFPPWPFSQKPRSSIVSSTVIVKES